MISLSFVNIQSYERVKKQNCIYKLSSDNKILSSLIIKAWCTCTFLNHFRKQMSNYYVPCVYRIDFVVIPSYIELPWYFELITDSLELFDWTSQLKISPTTKCKMYPSIIKIKQKFKLNKKFSFQCVSEAAVRKFVKTCSQIKLQLKKFQ